MNEVVLVPDHISRGFLTPLPEILNDCQSGFRFVVMSDTPRSGYSHPEDARAALCDAHARKVSLALGNEDLLLVFRRQMLSSQEFGLANLFMAGSTLSETPPRVGVISTSFIGRGILASDPMYLTQRHALYHLVVCAILGSFLDLQAHTDRGCLLDFNNFTPDIKLKINAGYVLCEGCEEQVDRHDLGGSISQICGALKARGSLDVAGIRTLPKLDFALIKVGTELSQADAFEALTAQLYARRGVLGEVVRVGAPDGGVDVLVKRTGRTLGVQCKFFVGEFGPAQVRQIRESYDSAEENFCDLDEFVLVVPRVLTKSQRQKVVDLASGRRLPLSIVDRDALLSLIEREPDLARRYFG